MIRRYEEMLDDPGPPEIIERDPYSPINMGRFWRHLV
jgi:hypothetical protein